MMTDYRMTLTANADGVVLMLSGRNGTIYTVMERHPHTSPNVLQTAINDMLLWVNRTRPDIERDVDAVPCRVPIITSESSARGMAQTAEIADYVAGYHAGPMESNPNRRYGLTPHIYGLPLIVMPDAAFPAFARSLVRGFGRVTERTWDVLFGDRPHWGPIQPPMPYDTPDTPPDLMTPPTPAEIDAEQIRLNRDAVRTFPNVTARRYVWDGPETCPPHLANPPREFPMPPGNRYVGTVCVAVQNGERIPLTDERGHADKPPVVGMVENVRTDAAGNVVCDVFLPPPIANWDVRPGTSNTPNIRADLSAACMAIERAANPLPMIRDMTIYNALKQPRPEPLPDDCDTPTIVGDTP